MREILFLDVRIRVENRPIIDGHGAQVIAGNGTGRHVLLLVSVPAEDAHGPVNCSQPNTR